MADHFVVTATGCVVAAARAAAAEIAVLEKPADGFALPPAVVCAASVSTVAHHRLPYFFALASVIRRSASVPGRVIAASGELLISRRALQSDTSAEWEIC